MNQKWPLRFQRHYRFQREVKYVVGNGVNLKHCWQPSVNFSSHNVVNSGPIWKEGPLQKWSQVFFFSLACLLCGFSASKKTPEAACPHSKHQLSASRSLEGWSCSVSLTVTSILCAPLRLKYSKVNLSIPLKNTPCLLPDFFFITRGAWWIFCP